MSSSSSFITSNPIEAARAGKIALNVKKAKAQETMRRVLRAIRDPENAGFEFQTVGYRTKVSGNRLDRALSTERSVQKSDSKRAQRAQLRRGNVGTTSAASSDSESMEL